MSFDFLSYRDPKNDFKKRDDSKKVNIYFSADIISQQLD